MSVKRLQEQNEAMREKIRKLEIALLNAEAILQTLVHHGKGLDEIHEIINKLTGRFLNLENEVKNQREMIVRSLQQKYGNGPTA